MAKGIRYCLALLCFAASVVCLALWGCGYEYTAGIDPGGWYATFSGSRGLGCISIDFYDTSLTERTILSVSVLNRSNEPWFGEAMVARGRFGAINGGICFPLWYPTLLFFLSGVAVLRVRRQFSIRSALTCVSVVAALLGMAVIL